MKNLIASAIVAGMVVAASAASAAENYNIAWTHYTGWEPFGYMQSSGIMAKYNKKHGVNVTFERVGDYVDSITLYTAKTYNGVAVTNMDVVAISGVGGRHSNAIIVGDYSNGNDALMFKGGKPVLQNGMDISLVQYSVSHYLLNRCAEMQGVDPKTFTLTNVSDADIPAIAAQANQLVTVTWNPIVMSLENSGMTRGCDSSKIPGEILDMLVVGDEVSPKAVQAIREAWFEVMDMMKTNKNNVLSALAEQAGSDVLDYQFQLRTTHMFATEKAEKAFVTDSLQLRSTMERVINFSFANGVYGDAIQDPTSLGVKFTDGTVLGNPTNVVLTFTKH